MTNTLKRQTLRNNEYYDTQNMFDRLYAQSKNNENFKKLYELIIDERNIRLAYRSIKRNQGSFTAGTDEKTISDIAESKDNEVIDNIRKRLKDYKPNKIRRVEIPKPDGSTRPLGIATIEDRLIQQCIKQVLEPIVEAKFHRHSYGFRPNRSVSHAMARVMQLININKLYYVVDIDIKSFFDNINHTKLKKQLWSMGIRDKRLLSIIHKMLTTEVENYGILNKGFADIAFIVERRLHNRFKKNITTMGNTPKNFQRLYPHWNTYKPIFLYGVRIFILSDVKMDIPIKFQQTISNYTKEGRNQVHQEQKVADKNVIEYLIANPIQNQSIEYNDNRISKYIAQKGNCAVTGLPLVVGQMDCHHKKPKSMGGTDEYQNLTFILRDVHKLVHATDEKTVSKYIRKLKLDEQSKRKINELRKLVNNQVIE